MTAKFIEDLNELLKNELSAIETYNQALSKYQDTLGLEVLTGCQASHSDRANKLRSAIASLNAAPTDDIGLGGKFAKLVMDGADKMGDKAILVALQADEGEWTATYEWRLVAMHGDYRPLVKEDLFPQQQQTEEKLCELANTATKGIWPATPGTKDI